MNPDKKQLMEYGVMSAHNMDEPHVESIRDRTMKQGVMSIPNQTVTKQKMAEPKKSTDSAAAPQHPPRESSQP